MVPAGERRHLPRGSEPDGQVGARSHRTSRVPQRIIPVHGRARCLISGVTSTLMDVLDSEVTVGPENERPERGETSKVTVGP